MHPHLLSWYDQHRRDLPWRRVVSPYRTLLSEIMLQQTRVDTVLPYFERFTALWPTLGALAQANDDDVLREWAGLGYYRRAHNLLVAVRVAHRAGGLPADVQALRTIPGIGPYTAGAIASIAFGIQTPVVDGNVHRVLSRYEAWNGDYATASGKRELWAKAATWVPKARPGCHNQAVMELGALVCTKRGPQCGTCPLRGSCVAFREGRVAELPYKRPKAAPKPIAGVAAYVRVGGGGVLLARRPKQGLLAGLWELPGVWPVPDLASPSVLRAAVADRLGLRGRVVAELGSLTHVFTHRKLRLRVFQVDVSGEIPNGPKSYYTDLAVVDDPGQLALSTLTRKALALAQRGPGLFATKPE